MSKNKAVLLDTSFFIRLLNELDPLSENAIAYYEYFINNNIEMLISTISIAEYCTIGKIEELPIKNLQIVPFNFNHAKKSGEYAKITFEARKKEELKVKKRIIIPNDTKLFAQASTINNIEYYLSSDIESKKVYNVISKAVSSIDFQFIELTTPCNEYFSRLF